MQVTTIERKLIHSFWVTNGSIRLSTVKNGQTNVITHISDLEELFPGNEILSDKVYVLALYVSPMRFSLIFFLLLSLVYSTVLSSLMFDVISLFANK